MLETVLEDSKPPVPPGAAALDYLLYTPFRYPPFAGGSRFRGPFDPGVWYGADTLRTSCAEVGYWRWRFVTASHGLARLDSVPHTVFQASARGAAIDLRVEPFVRDRGLWTDPAVYDACQSLAACARTAEVAIIRYQSVRDPGQGACGAVLESRALAGRAVRDRQTWFLTVDRRRASWIRAAAPLSRPARAGETHEFVWA